MLDIFIDFIACAIKGLVTSLLNSFKLDDNEVRLNENLLESEGKNIPNGFTEDDSIYIQYVPEKSRPCFSSELKQAFYCSLGILACGLLIGVTLSVLLFIDINSGHVCQEYRWDSLPQQIQRLKLTVQVVENLAVQMLHFVVMVSMFGVHHMISLNLTMWNITFGCLDAIYRLFLQVYGEYGAWWKNYPSHCFSFIYIYNSYILGRNFSESTKERIWLTVQYCMQFLLGLPLLDFTYYVLFPWYLNLHGVNQTLLAIFCPIAGEFVKTICRLVIQEVKPITHIGKSYHLMLCLLIGTTLVYRTLQARIETQTSFALLSFAHGVIGVLERITVVVRDYLVVSFCQKCLKRERPLRRLENICKQGTLRFITDVMICGFLNEISMLFYTNSFIQLLKVAAGMEDFRVALYFFLTRSLFGLAVESLFMMLNIFILTRYMNVAVTRLWKTYWKKYTMMNLLVSSILTVYITQYLIAVVDINITSNNSRSNSSCTLLF